MENRRMRRGAAVPHLPKWSCGDLGIRCRRRETGTWRSGTMRWQLQILCEGQVVNKWLHVKALAGWCAVEEGSTHRTPRSKGKRKM